MKFLQKRWVSVVLCLIMIIAAVRITSSRDRRPDYQPQDQNTAEAWAEESYGSYIHLIDDRASVLSERTVQELSVRNAALDYSYGSVCGVVVVKSVGQLSMEDAAYDLFDELQLSDADTLLLVDLTAEDWYYLYGSDFSYYVDYELEILFRGAMDGIYEDLDTGLVMLFSDLSDWYGEHLSSSESSVYQAEDTFGTALFVLVLIVILVVAIILSAVGRAGRRVVRGWGPTIIVGGHRHRPFHYGPGPRPGAGPGARPMHGYRPTQNRPAGRSGGFGGTNRGGFSGRPGGFGGKSRGGGFGGKR